PKIGTWFASDAGGKWTTLKLSPRVGPATLVVDTDTGELNVVLSDRSSLTVFRRLAGGDWTEKTLVTGWVPSPVLRQDPTTGDLILVFIGDVPGGDSGVLTMRRS